jgi:tetratricopeptide (TPR) repeat protein
LIVVHSGHNEFYGVGGLASTTGGISPRLYPLLEGLRRQRLFQLGLSLIHRSPNAHLLETLPADISIPLDSRVVVRVKECYRANVQKTVNLAVEAGIPILLTTIPSNLRDLSPMHSIARRDLTEQQQRQQAERRKTAARHFSYQEFEAALSTWRAARQLDPANALLAYREAQCLEGLNRFEEAAEAYVLACDLDGCRFRAPSCFESVVQRVASGGPDTVLFCDVAGRLRDESRLPVPGNDFFLEHVHYNLEGHWQVALILGKFIHERILAANWRPERVPSVERRDELLGVTPLDHLMGDSTTLMMFGVWPLKLAPDTPRQMGLVKARIQHAYARLSPLDRELFASLSLAAMQHELLVAMGKAYLDAGRQDLALEMFETHIRRRPWELSGYIGAAESQKRLGEHEAALKFLKQARDIAPGDPRIQRLQQSWSQQQEAGADDRDSG